MFCVQVLQTSFLAFILLDPFVAERYVEVKTNNSSNALFQHLFPTFQRLLCLFLWASQFSEYQVLSSEMGSFPHHKVRVKIINAKSLLLSRALIVTIMVRNLISLVD